MNHIYYFTGTGNSLQIARDLGVTLGNTALHKITEYKGEKITGESLGIVFPVYNWGIPLIIEKFLKELELQKETYVYAVADFGGLPGRALDQCQKKLLERGITLNAGFLIRMPGNYIMGYGAYSEELQQKLFASEARKVEEIATVVKAGKTGILEKSHKIVDRLFTNYFYKEVAHFHEADQYYTVNDQCVGCGLCARKCPVHNIKIVDKKPQWQHHCEMCVCCLESCPKEAINYKGKTEGRKRYLNPNIKD